MILVANRHASASVLALLRLARILDSARGTAILVVVALTLERALRIDAGALTAAIRLLEALVHVLLARGSGETKLRQNYFFNTMV